MALFENTLNVGYFHFKIDVGSSTFEYYFKSRKFPSKYRKNVWTTCSLNFFYSNIDWITFLVLGNSRTKFKLDVVKALFDCKSKWFDVFSLLRDLYLRLRSQTDILYRIR